MTRNRTTQTVALVAVVAMLAMGTSMALAVGPGTHATTDATAEDPAAVQETTTTPETTTAAETANVTFEDQTSNGTAVVVEEVVVPEGGYVVIHAAEAAEGTPVETTPGEDGVETEMGTETEVGTGTETEMGTETAVADAGQQYTAGDVLGNSTYLEPGVHENVTVELADAIEESQVLIAMPHLDTNDNQQYEFPEADDPYTQDGEAVIDWASVTVEGEDGADETTPEDETTTEEA